MEQRSPSLTPQSAQYILPGPANPNTLAYLDVGVEMSSFPLPTQGKDSSMPNVCNTQTNFLLSY